MSQKTESGEILSKSTHGLKMIKIRLTLELSGSTPDAMKHPTVTYFCALRAGGPGSPPLPLPLPSFTKLVYILLN